MKIDDDVLDSLIEIGYSEEYEARNLKRVFKEYIEEPFYRDDA